MNTPFVPTARNSERWNRPDHGPANKYIPGASLVRQKEDRQERINKAATLRQVERMRRHAVIDFDGTPYQRGCLALLEQLLGIREAHNLETLFDRDRRCIGFIESAHAFGSIELRQLWSLQKLRNNAFDHRYQELKP